ncbi:Alcohol dehydrogenase, class IV [Sphaerochaeta associata]|uniref:Iron-containing alcohol dehydrogenase n=1 Tax=Sphaerochaeta associata TaxID=1129264 RepID=A0ABY4D8P1_9SPIR|nr:iron-containing alcohol dehydrogenase [Sphaerochaeta associata]UOM50370.1 iron-containing alcohol dehydrogenase [Sphaerochaeta associata]SMP42352.1 Alcohol dehydrogenase, class IV [Sphaerochaeta associata]
MIESLQSTVHILSVSDLDADTLSQILTFSANKAGRPTVCAVIDNAPIPAKDVLLKDLERHAIVHRFDQVQPNPRTVDIMRMYEDPEFASCDVVLGIGGGSTLDSAKALAMLASNGGSLAEYLGNKPLRTITERAKTLVLIPTTAGTGSEVTKVGVYTDPLGRKYTLGSPLMSARTAVLASSLLEGVPPSLCAATGLDALDHALESIWNKNSTPLTKTIARNAAIEILETLPKLYQAIKKQSPDKQSLIRSMLAASTKAGIAFNLTGTAAGHAISFILSEEWHVPHGLACAFTLLEVFDWAVQDESNRKELAQIGKHFHPTFGDDQALEALREDISSLMQRLAIPTKFADIKVDLTDLSVFDRCLDDPKLLNQLPPLGKKDLHRIIEAKR